MFSPMSKIKPAFINHQAFKNLSMEELDNMTEKERSEFLHKHSPVFAKVLDLILELYDEPIDEQGRAEVIYETLNAVSIAFTVHVNPLEAPAAAMALSQVMDHMCRNVAKFYVEQDPRSLAASALKIAKANELVKRAQAKRRGDT